MERQNVYCPDLTKALVVRSVIPAWRQAEKIPYQTSSQAEIIAPARSGEAILRGKTE